MKFKCPVIFTCLCHSSFDPPNHEKWKNNSLLESHTKTSGRLNLAHGLELVSLGCYNRYHSLGGSNDTQSFLTVLEAVKSKTEMLADVVSAESLIPGLLMATSLLYPHRTVREIISLSCLFL